MAHFFNKKETSYQGKVMTTYLGKEVWKHYLLYDRLTQRHT